jgi:hypothetical protein
VDIPLDATDLGGYPLTVTVSGLPSGLNIDPSKEEKRTFSNGIKISGFAHPQARSAKQG